MKWCAIAAFSICASAAQAAEPGDLDYVTASSLPAEAIGAFMRLRDYAYDARINPFYLHADFNGDGKPDMAVLVRNRTSGAKGIAFSLSGRDAFVIGAGVPWEPGFENFDWMDAWQVQRKGNVAKGATGEGPPKLKGDAILAIKTESASGLIWWDGKRFRWYQQGD